MQIAGHCGKCGAPYFMPTLAGNSEPQITPTCACWNVPGGSRWVLEPEPGDRMSTTAPVQWVWQLDTTLDNRTYGKDS